MILAAAVLTLAVLAAPVRLDALGDSITWGDGTDNPATQAYPVVLGTMLGAVSVKNHGLPGATSRDVLAKEVPAIDQSANLVVVNAGTNDVRRVALRKPPSLEAREATYRALLAAVRHRLPRATLVVVTVRNVGWYNDPAVRRYVRHWNANVRLSARRYDARVLDLETDRQWYRASEWDAKKLHPNVAGARHLAAAIAALV